MQYHTSSPNLFITWIAKKYYRFVKIVWRGSFAESFDGGPALRARWEIAPGRQDCNSGGARGRLTFLTGFHFNFTRRGVIFILGGFR